MSKNLSHLSGRKGLEYNLFEQLGLSAKGTGTPDKNEMERLQNEFLFGKANIHGTVSFYDFLKQENEGKKIYTCNGSACMTANTQDKVKNEIANHFPSDAIGEMCCLGRCHENSAFHYQGKNYSGQAIDHLQAIIQNQYTYQDTYTVNAFGTPVITRPYPELGEYYEIWSSCLKKTPISLLEELQTSGLRGRGGAGFPIAFKLASCRETESNTKYIVCNADEGDPGAYSDRYIMEHRPHALLMGMLIAGYITGAQWGVLYIRAEYPESISTIADSVAQLEQAGFIGENILDSGFNFNFKIIKAQGAYICGEETALLSSIEGQRPEVRVRPPFPTQKGLFNQPTVVNNVETLACIPYIMELGGTSFAKIGKGKSTGTKLISLDGYFNRPGIYEVDMGTPMSKVIHQLGGGFKIPVKAIHIGGPLGGIVPVHKLDTLTADFESFAQSGFLLGHASYVCIPTSYPIIEYIKHLFLFTAHESCGKCFPCRIGSTRGYEMLEKATTSEYKIDKKLMADLLETLEIGSLCALGGGLPLPVKNALTYFEDELAKYFSAPLP
ncbi:MAG: formate dehydrogenase [Saprospiraceae bacterium]|nr:formate dehydrogenase [Saprospiraceae bacterium]